MTSATALEVGTWFTTTLVEDLKRTQIVQFAGASGDFNPLHTDERYAIEVGGFDTVFAHGMLTMGLTSTVINQFKPEATAVRFGGRFVAQVWPGDTLTAITTVIDRRVTDCGDEVDLEIITKNQHGAAVFNASATLRVLS